MRTGPRVRWLVAGAFHPTPTGRHFPLTASAFTEELSRATRGWRIPVRDRLGAGDLSTYAPRLDTLDDFALAEVVRHEPDLQAVSARYEALAPGGDARGLLEEALYGTARDVLQHPPVARLESAWRGLHWLWTHCPAESGMEVEVLDVAPGHLARALAERLDGPPLLAPDACFLLEPEGTPEALSQLAALGEAASVPLVVPAPAAVRGDGQRLAGEQDFQPPEAWRALRRDEAARWLCAALNPVVMKAERLGPVTRECFASPVFAVAALLAASLRDTRTFARLGGAGSATRAPAVWRPSGGAPLATERSLSLREQQRLASHGLVGVSGWPDSDAVQLAAAPTVYGGREAAPLPAQLLTGRIVRLIQEVAGRLPAGASQEEIAAVCARAAAAFLPSGAPGGCELLGRRVGLGGGEWGLHVRASLRPELAGTALRLELTVPLP